jgi:hypothetical protein
VKLIPRGNQIIGRVVIKRVFSTIIRVDETKETTKFVLVDAVGPDAAAKGFKVGDIVLPTQMSNIKLDGGAFFRPLVNADYVAAYLTDVNVEELGVQTDGGTEYVAFGAPRAATPLAESPPAEARAPEAA